MSRQAYLERNIKIFYAQAFLSNLAFFLPVMTLFFNTIADSVTLVALLFTIQSIVSVIFEVPSGAFADVFGRRNTLLLADFLSILALGFLAVSTNYTMLVIFSLIFSFKNTLASGTDEAVIYDTLKELRKDSIFKKFIARQHMLSQAGTLVGSLAGGLMAGQFLRLPFLLSIPIPVVMFFLTLFMLEPKYQSDILTSVFDHAKKSLKFFKKNRQLLLLSVFGVISFGLQESMWHLRQIFFEYVHLPIEYFGVALAGVSILGVAGAWCSHSLAERFGDKRVLIASYLIDYVMMLVAAIILGWQSVVLLVAGGFLFTVGSPIMSHLLNEEIPSSHRSTLLSITNLGRNLGYACLAPLLGYVADLYTIAFAFKAASVVLIAATSLLFFIKD